MLICTANNDPYSLAKINFFNNYNENKTLKRYTDKFNKILKYKKNNNFDLENLFEELDPKKSDSGEYFEYDEFIDFLMDAYNITIDTHNINSYNLFADIIINIDNRIDSPDISTYKKCIHKQWIYYLRHKNR